MLPGTEIYSSWGHIQGETPIWGNGFGLSLGYLVTTWKSIHIYSDLDSRALPWIQTIPSQKWFLTVPRKKQVRSWRNSTAIPIQFWRHENESILDGETYGRHGRYPP